VFLDRDGTLIEDISYLGDPSKVALLPGAVDSLARLASVGYALVVISNQAGVARGLISEADVRGVNARMAELLVAQGVQLDGIYYCPHHPKFTGACECRKPGTGMIDCASRDLGLDLASSWMVGDSLGDVEAGRKAGARSILVRTGSQSAAAEHAVTGSEVPVTDDLAAAADLILAARANDGP